MKFEISVSGWEDEDIETSIVDQVAGKLASRIQERVDQKIDHLIDNLAEEKIAARIEGEIATVLEAGWFETDNYGQRKGPRVTISDRVNSALNAVGKDNYGRYCLSRLVDASITKRFDDAMTDAVKRLKEKVDSVINTTIDETITGEIKTKIRKALGTAA